MSHRLPALDWMRGIVMLLMVTDHAGEAFDRRHLITDSALFYAPEVALPALQFFNRWISHLCAPTFVFLAGVALALSIERKRARGVPDARIDRDLLIRGVLILAVDFVFINWFWAPGIILLQVMYAIGGAMILMVAARRLPSSWLAVLAFLVLLVAEITTPTKLVGDGGLIDGLRRLMLGPGLVDNELVVSYPLLPWWAVMALGWIFGRWLLVERNTPNSTGAALAGSAARLTLVAGALGLAIFVVLRGLNGFGNHDLLRLDNSLVQWLHVSKYPPSMAFLGLELGLMGLILAGLFAWQRTGEARSGNPVLVFGQTAFFFYILHILVLEVAARGLGMHHQRGIVTSWIASLAVIVLLYPVCLWYRRVKAARRHSWLRFF